MKQVVEEAAAGAATAAAAGTEVGPAWCLLQLVRGVVSCHQGQADSPPVSKQQPSPWQNEHRWLLTNVLHFFRCPDNPRCSAGIPHAHMASKEPPNRPAVCSCICTSNQFQLIANHVVFCTGGRVGVEAKCRCACYPLPLSLEHHQRPMLLAQQHVERNFQGHIFLVQCVVEVPSHESVLIVAPVVVLVVLAEQNLVQLVLVVVVEQLGLQVVSAQSWVTAVATLVLSWLVAAEAHVAAFAPVLSWLALSQLVVVPAAAMGSLVAAEVLVAAGPVEPVEPHGRVASVAPMVSLLATVVLLQTAMGSLDPLGGWVSMGVVVVAVVPRRRKSPVVAQHQRPLWLGAS